MFTDAAVALGDADAALRLVESAAPGNRALEGQFHTLKGRTLLNLGRFAEAREELEIAMRLLGNLTLRVDRADLLARSDLAIAALLSGLPDRARRYLAYTGAGRFRTGAINVRGPAALPPCGGDLAPDDVVVVELLIRDDGNVGNAMPVYASRQGPSAIAFARALSRWSFEAKQASDVPDLLRSVVRIEARCSAEIPARRHDEDMPAAQRSLAAADPRWAAILADQESRPARALRAALAAQERRGEAGRREILPLLLLLAHGNGVGSAEREAFLRRALAIAAELDAPAPVRAAIALAIGRERLIRDYDALLALPEIAGSAEAAALVRLASARHRFDLGNFDEASGIAAAIRAMPEAGSGSPLALQALEIEAAVLGARPDPAAARTAAEAMGAHFDPCAIGPRHRGFSASYRDFPDEALRWGFEGWGGIEVSATPRGAVAGTRIVAAYPPFVFGEAARRIALRNRYDAFFAPDGRACIADRQWVRFRLPG